MLKICLMYMLFSLAMLTPNITFAKSFSENDVKSFVYSWFGLFDTNAPVKMFLPRMVDEGLNMKFPEAKIATHNDFIGWYEGILKNIATASHDVKDLQVDLTVDNKYLVQLLVLWQAKTVEGEQLRFLAQQRWIILVQDDVLKIKSYIVSEGQEQTQLSTDKPILLSCKTVSSPDDTKVKVEAATLYSDTRFPKKSRLLLEFNKQGMTSVIDGEITEFNDHALTFSSKNQVIGTRTDAETLIIAYERTRKLTVSRADKNATLEVDLRKDQNVLSNDLFKMKCESSRYFGW